MDQPHAGRANPAQHRLGPHSVLEKPLRQHNPVVARLVQLAVEEPVLIARQLVAVAKTFIEEASPEYRGACAGDVVAPHQ